MAARVADYRDGEMVTSNMATSTAALVWAAPPNWASVENYPYINCTPKR